MELTLAINILETTVATKQKEVDALNLAINSLKGQFAPELTVLAHAQQVAVDEAATIATLNEDIAAKDAIILSKDAQIVELAEPVVEVPVGVTP